MDINLLEYQQLYNKERFPSNGLSDLEVKVLKEKYGSNLLPVKKKKGIIAKIFSALCEPMIIILLFAWVITLGVSIGNFMAGKSYDFYETFGILGAIFLSVGLTIFMESKSEKAFETLKKLTNSIHVSVLRNNKIILVEQSDICVGDILFCEAGNKIVADSLILEGDAIECEESILTGEVSPVEKKPFVVSNKIKCENMLFSGCYLKNGYAKVRVLAVGKNAQMGKIANVLQEENASEAPLTLKLTKLSKKISIFGGITAIFTFLLSLLRLYLINGLNFENVKEVFVEAIVLIVAAVPEGLPSTVAIALALSVVKLAKSNAVIKKLIAAETAGCVSVICSDKTGTLTVGKMQVNKFYTKDGEYLPSNLPENHIFNNIVHNSTATFINDNGKISSYGNSTEQALINAILIKNYQKLNELRKQSQIISREPFNSKRKYMASTILANNDKVVYYKGSIEKIVEICNLNESDSKKYLNLANYYASQGERIIAFAHFYNDEYLFDGFCVISDEIRKDVYESVKNCKKAGIAVKILTGDNKHTAIGIAKKLSLAHDFSNVLTGQEIFEMTDNELMELLPQITIVARSTPETKLRIVNLLKRMGEVVAVTGDGVNDAPAVKNADIGIAMGDGSDITKEASDIILLDNSFSVIVKAVAFGRNIYRNFQRFLFFQLTVNFSAVGIIIGFLFMGFESPFTTLQLLWINIIMDGPLALSLALERRDNEYMDDLPVRRTDSIINKRVFIRIAFHSLVIIIAILLQKQFNFLGASVTESSTVIFCIFVFFQLFNAINARELGTKSVIPRLGKNVIFSALLILTLIMQVVITQLFSNLFATVSLNFKLWLKIIITSFSIIVLSEISKFVYSKIKYIKFTKKINKRNKFA